MSRTKSVNTSALIFGIPLPARFIVVRCCSTWSFASYAARSSLLVGNRIAQYADAFDLDLADVAAFHPDRRLARMPDAGRRAGDQDVAGLERHRLRDIGDRFGDEKHHVVGIVGLHHLAVQPALDFQPL